MKKAKEELSHWMIINSDWRLACKEEWVNDDSYSAASYEDSDRYPAVRIAYIQSKLPSGWIVGFSDERERPYYTHPVHGQTWFCPFEINFGEYVAHLAASLPPPAQTSVSDLSAGSVAPPEMIPIVSEYEDIIMANGSPAMFLNNPAVAIELGRVDILKYLVEDIGIDTMLQQKSGHLPLGAAGSRHHPIPCHVGKTPVPWTDQHRILVHSCRDCQCCKPHPDGFVSQPSHSSACIPPLTW